MTNFEGLGPRVLAHLEKYDGSTPRKHTLGSHNLGKPEEITYVNRDKVTQAFVRGAIDFMKKYDFDGLDLDYEFPDAADKIPYGKWVKELSEALDQPDAEGRRCVGHGQTSGRLWPSRS